MADGAGPQLSGGSRRHSMHLAAATMLAASALTPTMARADEGGLYGSLAAAPSAPGWGFLTFYYHTSVSAGADVTASRLIQIGALNPTLIASVSANLHNNTDFEWLNPTYVFATPVLGGQLSLGMGTPVGAASTSVSGILNASIPPVSFVRAGTISDSVVGVGDLYPQATLKWNSGVNNFMVYGTGDIPVGTYSSTSLANLGIGHGAVDGGFGYTYLDTKTGHEFSAVGGFAYNLINPATQYQNGVDFHLDWGASQYLSKQVFVGAVGYFYDQISGDSGSGDRVGPFESRVIGIGPQVGYIFPIGHLQGYVNLKGYGEFDSHDRPSGFNLWATFAISQAPAMSETTFMMNMMNHK
jgi:hypothetical protein